MTVHVTFPSGTLVLEGQLAEPPAPVGAAVVCHPHPQYGGTMYDPVVRAVAEGLVERGWATLRFNFRGVGESEGAYAGGHGEAEDARAAVAWLAQRTGGTRVGLAGYSFGALVALTAAAALPAVEFVIAVAPPLAVADAVPPLATRTLLLLGSADPFCPAERAGELARGATAVACRVLPGADHFFRGYADALTRAVVDFLAPAGPAAPCGPA